MAKIKMSMTPITQVTVAAAGTPVPLSATELLVSSVIVQYEPSNAGTLYIGDATVTASKCLKLDASNVALEITPDQNIEDEDQIVIDLATIYIDAAVSGDKVNIAYLAVASKEYNG